MSILKCADLFLLFPKKHITFTQLLRYSGILYKELEYLQIMVSIASGMYFEYPRTNPHAY